MSTVWFGSPVPVNTRPSSTFEMPSPTMPESGENPVMLSGELALPPPPLLPPCPLLESVGFGTRNSSNKLRATHSLPPLRKWPTNTQQIVANASHEVKSTAHCRLSKDGMKLEPTCSKTRGELFSIDLFRASEHQEYVLRGELCELCRRLD
jgi:hypothetical protein